VATVKGVRRWAGTAVAVSLISILGIQVAHAAPADDMSALELSPSTTDFGEVLNVYYNAMDPRPVVSSSTRTFTMTSTGSLDVPLGAASLSGVDADQFAISRNTCPSAPASTCEIDVTFTPRSVGPRSATLEVPSGAPGGMRTATLTGTGVPKVVVTRLTAEPVTFSAGPLGGVRLFPRASLTDAATGKALPQLSMGDTGREVVFTVGGRTVCTAVAAGPEGIASCQGLVPFLAVLLGGGYDAHFELFSYGGVRWLASDAHGPLIG
jgi:hypothetical protein